MVKKDCGSAVIKSDMRGIRVLGLVTYEWRSDGTTEMFKARPVFV